MGAPWCTDGGEPPGNGQQPDRHDAAAGAGQGLLLSFIARISAPVRPAIRNLSCPFS